MNCPSRKVWVGMGERQHGKRGEPIGAQTSPQPQRGAREAPNIACEGTLGLFQSSIARKPKGGLRVLNRGWPRAAISSQLSLYRSPSAATSTPTPTAAMAVHMRKHPGQLTVVIKLGKYHTVQTLRRKEEDA